MTWKKFEYFLNAVFYHIWLNDKLFTRFINKLLYCTVGVVIRLIAGFICKYKVRNKHHEKISKEYRQHDEYIYRDEYGINIGGAEHWFRFAYLAYPSIPMFIIAATLYKTYEKICNETCEELFFLIIILIISIIPYILVYCFVEKAVLKNNKYLEYFKQFKKEDKRWNTKWEIITLFFFIGALISFIIAIAAMWLVFLYL